MHDKQHYSKACNKAAIDESSRGHLSIQLSVQATHLMMDMSRISRRTCEKLRSVILFCQQAQVVSYEPTARSMLFTAQGDTESPHACSTPCSAKHADTQHKKGLPLVSGYCCHQHCCDQSPCKLAPHHSHKVGPAAVTGCAACCMYMPCTTATITAIRCVVIAVIALC